MTIGVKVKNSNNVLHENEQIGNNDMNNCAKKMMTSKSEFTRPTKILDAGFENLND